MTLLVDPWHSTHQGRPLPKLSLTSTVSVRRRRLVRSRLDTHNVGDVVPYRFLSESTASHPVLLLALCRYAVTLEMSIIANLTMRP
jgi:hypothetical protein